MDTTSIVTLLMAFAVGLLSVFLGVYQHGNTAIDVDTKFALLRAANEARGLALDSIAAAKSGHMGLPLGAAEIGATLFGLEVSYCT